MTATLFPLAFRSLWNRRGTALLTVVAIAISVALLLGVQRVRTETRASFANTISGTDLIVGARSGPLNLLLYSVFRVGDATANVSWDSYQKIARHPDVAWTIPLSLGDSHRGFRVLGTDANYFAHYRFAAREPLRFSAGGPFQDLHDAVIGADIADTLRYGLGTPIVIAHGLGDVSFAEHRDEPFRVVGILKRTGTPVDRTVHIDLRALTAIHADWQSGRYVPGETGSHEHDPVNLQPASLTAFLVGMKSKQTLFVMQRAINEYRVEPLQAVIPGVALAQLWSLVGVADRALYLIAGCVVLAGLLGMTTMLLASLAERRREMAILRSVGARPRHIFTLLVWESGLLALAGTLLGVLLTYATLFTARPWLEQRYGIFMSIGALDRYDMGLLGVVVGAGVLIGAIPAWRAYRTSLADGLAIRI